ncbi:MAG: MFS transporter [Firmicutes bacterium HGW-Firmicutes-16]|nr:MAG: MFS transporter [Firmicutes bacterium HGW-Firmicutes-16]
MKLNYKRTIFVGFAFFLISAFWQGYDTIIPKILTDKFGMSQSLSGAIMGLDNILALFMLPLFGVLSDKCKSPRGRRTPFIIAGTVIAAVFLVMLSFADSMQLKNISAVAPTNPTAQVTLYDAGLSITTPDGKTVAISDMFTKDEYTAITMTTESGGTNPDYTNYIVPARHAYAAAVVANDKTPLIIFIAILFVLLLSMSTFRSPAVALMPDVTIKPLRSKANAVINLMGAAGGIIILGLGMAFKTGSAANALMSYKLFFICIAGLMIVSLLIFLWRVKEPKLVKAMHEESRKYNIDQEEDDDSGSRKLSKGEKISLVLILSSVVFWFFGYNAVTSKYSVYASSVLNLDYNNTLMIATGAAILSYIPVGALASKIGRKKSIMAGIILLGTAFLSASFIRAGSSTLVMNILFAMAGIGWATINVNSYPMVVELSKGSEVGKYTGVYYTASMAAQTLTPFISGMFMDKVSMTTLFPYGCVFVFLAFITMLFVKHGDNKPIPAGSKLEAFGSDD